MKPSLLQIINFWPPFLILGIRVNRYQKDLRTLDVEMGLRFWNWNHQRTHFGGSLFAMTDPFYALLIREHINEKIVIWVKSATIQFKKPGRGTVYAQFALSSAKLQELRLSLKSFKKAETHFLIEIKDKKNNVIAIVDQVIYLRKRETLSKFKEKSLKAS